MCACVWRQLSVVEINMQALNSYIFKLREKERECLKFLDVSRLSIPPLCCPLQVRDPHASCFSPVCATPRSLL